MTGPATRRRRPRSQPARWTQRNVPRRWRNQLAPPTRPKRPKGIPGVWTRLRRMLWAWWPWAIAMIWAVGADRWFWAVAFGAIASVTYLSAPHERSPSYGLDHEFAVGSPEFVSSLTGATGVPFVKGNTLAILNNGDRFYPAMLDAIKGAKYSITIEAYIYWAGEIGVTFARALASRAGAGVQVKILLDAVGSATIGEEILRILKDGGCQLAWYNPIRWYTIGRVNNRTHRKSVIVDGRVAFTGGAGIADQWMGDAQDENHWRDIQIRIEGPAATALQTGFTRNWLATTGELVSGFPYYPGQSETGTTALQIILSSPETGSSTVRIVYYLSIVCARRSIYIANPYFVPDHAAIATLVDAKRRGVDVKLMVSGIYNDNWLARYNSLGLYGPLLAAGIEIHEYNRTMLHQKTMVVDEEWGTIGTSNFDNRSFALNEENNVCFYDREQVRELVRTFRADLAGCDRVELEAWRRRGIWTKTLEVVASLMREQV
jgi:cardiolipin synthase